MLPRVSHIAENHARDLGQYVRSGGVLVVTGTVPEFDEKGQRPAAPPLAGLVEPSAASRSPSVRRLGEGTEALIAAALRRGDEAGRVDRAGSRPPVLDRRRCEDCGVVKVRVTRCFREPDRPRYVMHLVSWRQRAVGRESANRKLRARLNWPCGYPASRRPPRSTATIPMAGRPSYPPT